MPTEPSVWVLSKPRETAEGGVGGVEGHLHKPGPRTRSVRHVVLLFLNYLVKRR